MIAQPGEAVRLDHRDHAPGAHALAGGGQHGADFDRVVAVIVDHGDPVDLTHLGKAAFDPGKLGKAGADVVVNYVKGDEAAKEVVDTIISGGSKAFAYQADVSKEDQVQAMFKRMCEEFGTIDILINNAGIQKDSKFTEMSLDLWNLVIGINLTGQFLCAREAVREFKRRGVIPEVSVSAGKIICISSVHDVIPWGGHVNYAASKGGVMLMMKSIAQEVAPDRIRVNSICPGAIRTPINTAAWDTPEAYSELMTLVPYQRIGEPEDIGRMSVFLASDMADYMTGANVYIDGGMTLYPGFASGG